MTQSVVAGASTPCLPPTPLDVIIRGQETPVAYACAKCGMLFLLGKNDEEEEREEKYKQAAAHCMKQCVCGEAIDYYYYLRCQACRQKADKDKERERFTKADHLSLEDYTEAPVYWEGHIGGLGDGYFGSVDEVVDYCEEEGIDLPNYVWACSAHKFSLDGRAFLEQELECQELYEDAGDDISSEAIDRLQAYLDVWAEELSLTGWAVDYKRAVLLHAVS